MQIVEIHCAFMPTAIRAAEMLVKKLAESGRRSTNVVLPWRQSQRFPGLLYDGVKELPAAYAASLYADELELRYGVPSREKQLDYLILVGGLLQASVVMEALDGRDLSQFGMYIATTQRLFPTTYVVCISHGEGADFGKLHNEATVEREHLRSRSPYLDPPPEVLKVLERTIVQGADRELRDRRMFHSLAIVDMHHSGDPVGPTGERDERGCVARAAKWLLDQPTDLTGRRSPLTATLSHAEIWRKKNPPAADYFSLHGGIGGIHPDFFKDEERA